MLTPALIQNIRAFMARVPLRGDEVSAFTEIMNALAQAELLSLPATPPPE